MDALAVLKKLIEDEMRDIVKLAFANTLTSSTPTRLDQRVIDGRKREGLSGLVLVGPRGDNAVTRKHSPGSSIWCWTWSG